MTKLQAFLNRLPRIQDHIRTRRLRPGVTLLEAALSLVIIGLGVGEGIRLVTDHAAHLALQAEARMLSAIADDYADTVGTNLVGALPLGRVTGWSPPSHLRLETPFGREIRIAHFTPANGQLVVVAYTWSADRITNRKPVPRYDSHMSRIGHVAGPDDRCQENHVCGPGMDWDASSLLTHLGSAGPGGEDLVALRWLTMARNAYPYLHRGQVAGHPDLNRMETDLDMGGGNILDAGMVTGETFSVLDGPLAIGGTLSAANLDISGNLNMAGNLVSTGSLVVQNLQASSDATFGTLEIGERLDLGDASITGTTTVVNLQADSGIELTGTGEMDVAGTIHADRAEIDLLEVTGDFNGAVLDYGQQATTLNRVRTRELIVTEMTVGNCQNC